MIDRREALKVGGALLLLPGAQVCAPLSSMEPAILGPRLLSGPRCCCCDKHIGRSSERLEAIPKIPALDGWWTSRQRGDWVAYRIWFSHKACSRPSPFNWFGSGAATTIIHHATDGNQRWKTGSDRKYFDSSVVPRRPLHVMSVLSSEVRHQILPE